MSSSSRRRSGSGSRSGSARSSASRSPNIKLVGLKLRKIEASRSFWLLAALMVLAFFTGGSELGNVASLMVLRPAACLLGAVGLLTLSSDQVKAYRWLFLFMAACLLLVGLEVVALPPALYARLPGRELFGEIGAAAGLDGVWRAMSFTPFETWDSLWAMSVPAAALILCVQLSSEDHRKLLVLMLLLGLFSALLAVAQISGDPKGPLYFYEGAVGKGNATGLFANKNHQAVFLATLVPMLFALRDMTSRRIKDERKARTFRIVMLVVVLGMVPLLLVTNSRAGLGAGAIGLVVGIWAFGHAKAKRIGAILLGLGGAALFGLAIISDRALAWNRLVELDPIEDLRYKILPLVRDAIFHLAPWGAGGGGFVKYYILKEPDSLLSPVIMNQVHDDWLDVPFSHGVAGVLLLGLLVACIIRMGWKVLRRHLAQSSFELGRAGVIALVLLGVGSLSDYPLRTPAIEAEWVVLMVWLVRAWQARPRLAAVGASGD